MPGKPGKGIPNCAAIAAMAAKSGMPAIGGMPGIPGMGGSGGILAKLGLLDGLLLGAAGFVFGLVLLVVVFGLRGPRAERMAEMSPLNGGGWG